MNEQAYSDGYAEGRRTALHLVVPLEDSQVYASAAQSLSEPWRPDSFRAYWLGMRRAMRLHYNDAYRPNVLAARKRHGA